MKRLFFATILLNLSQIFPMASSHWDEEQVAKYVHYSEMQCRSTWHLLSKVEFHSNDTILDIGCGDGRNTAWISHKVSDGYIVGIDPSEAMLSWARKQYHPFDYPNLEFRKGDALHLPDEHFDVITSFFSLHLAEQKQAALSQVFTHLNPGGYFICVLPYNRNAEYSEALEETMHDPEWSPYFHHFKSTFHFAALEQYERYCAHVGFEIEKAEYIPTIDPFVSKKEFAKWFEGTMPLIHCLPKHLRKKFIYDIINRYVEKRPEALEENGVINFYFGHCELIARKPYFY